MTTWSPWSGCVHDCLFKQHYIVLAETGGRSTRLLDADAQWFAAVEVRIPLWEGDDGGRVVEHILMIFRCLLHQRQDTVDIAAISDTGDNGDMGDLVGQVSMSMPNTRFSRCAQVIEARRSAGVGSSESAVVAR